MKVLAVASEIHPLVKTGGLADVTGALPAALGEHGIEVRTLVPGYRDIMKRVKRKTAALAYDALFGSPARIVTASVDGLDLLVLDAPHLFDRPGGPYGEGGDFDDNWRRFAALGKAGADVAEGLLRRWVPDVVHAHDWQAAMVPAYMRYGNAHATPSVMTIHNLAFQGQFPASIFPLLGLPDAAMALDGVEYYGGVGFLKAGIQAASAVTTVSPGYAQEIRTPAFGMGLDGLIDLRAADLHGILNGIDTRVWNPADDGDLVATYSEKTLGQRARNRRAIAERLGLAQDDSPLLCVVSRLTWQKGIDVLASVIDEIVARGFRLAILGSGDHALEGAMLAAAARHPGRAAVVIGYSESLSHLLQGGADAILIPSRFEPCGLTQLYGLRYGCVPVVARTGGLADTIIDANEAALAAGVATGFQFAPVEPASLLAVLDRLAAVWREPAQWQRMQRQGMRSDVSWERSAARYAALFRQLAED